eukprot:8857046-Alexandrium_andersonii.AAC.1
MGRVLYADWAAASADACISVCVCAVRASEVLRLGGIWTRVEAMADWTRVAPICCGCGFKVRAGRA